jgi:threonine dehydratase
MDQQKDWEIPGLRDVFDARRRISPHLSATPLVRYPALDEIVGATLYVKHENHLPTGAFKVRGGLNLMSRLSSEDRSHGVVSASTGNHGQSIAYAAKLFGVQATICVPEGANPVKVAAIESLGAEVLFHGRDFDDARVRCEQLAIERGCRYVHSANEPHLVAGVATAALEVIEQEPDIEAIVVAVGGGSGASGACIVTKAVDPRIEVIGVQSEAAPAAYLSWKAGALVESTMETCAEGLATRTAFALTQQILRQHLDEFVLVSDEALRGRASSLDPRHPQPRRGGRCRLVGRRARVPPTALRPQGGTRAERRQCQPRGASGGTRLAATRWR